MASLDRFAKDCVKKGISLLGAYDWRHRGNVTLLMYHRVLPQAQLIHPVLQASVVASTAAFERNMRFLRRRYTVISFKEYLDRVDNNDWASNRRYAIVTFDDGWSDTYFHAFPILAKYEIPATVFLVTSHVGTGRVFWWQAVGDALLAGRQDAIRGRGIRDLAREQGVAADNVLREIFDARAPDDMGRRIDTFIEQLKAQPPRRLQQFANDCASITGASSEPMAMTWQQIAEMSTAGIEFGSHTANHYRLTALSVDDAVAEITDSAAALQSRPEINYTPVFAYPNGDNNQQVRDLVRAAGYRAAVTTHPMVTGFQPNDTYGLPRINIASHVAASNLLFKFKLSHSRAERASSKAMGLGRA